MVPLPTRVSWALRWIVDILDSHNIPYQISGGVATRFYGARRKINDIDIDISEKYFPVLKNLFGDKIIWGPEKSISSEWIINTMQVNYS